MRADIIVYVTPLLFGYLLNYLCERLVWAEFDLKESRLSLSGIWNLTF